MIILFLLFLASFIALAFIAAFLIPNLRLYSHNTNTINTNVNYRNILTHKPRFKTRHRYIVPSNRRLYRTSTKTTSIKRKFGWNDFSSNNKYDMIGVTELRNELTLFFNYYKETFPKHKYFAILFRMKINNEIRSCSYTQIATLNGFDQLLAIFSKIFFLETFSENVSQGITQLFIHPETKLPRGDIFFSYKPIITLEGTKYSEFTPLDEGTASPTNTNFLGDFKYKNLSIPATMDLDL